MKLDRPTKELVERYGKQFDKNNSVEEEAIKELGKIFPDNSDYKGVLLKSIVINTLYATQIGAIVKVARHIFSLDIDAGLKRGDPQVVDKIARVIIKEKERRNYAFATKYCSFHNPSEYPIYDSFVDRLLKAYQKQDRFSPLSLGDLKDYGRFKEVLKAFVGFYEMGTINAKELDSFLWGYGKEIFPGRMTESQSVTPLSPASRAMTSR
jgi:hypothetical protein